jgi:hypothetical protein
VGGEHVVVCLSCGQRNREGAEFCSSCDRFLEWSGRAAEETPDPQPDFDVPVAQAVVTTLTGSSHEVAPGSQVVFSLEIRNRGRTVDQLAVEVVGDAAAWAEVEHPVPARRHG